MHVHPVIQVQTFFNELTSWWQPNWQVYSSGAILDNDRCQSVMWTVSVIDPQELKGQMSQLRPLLSVVDQYRLDLQTLATLRMELLNLSVMLASIQEEVGAYDYEELQQRVLLLETRLHSCMNKLGMYWRVKRVRKP